MKKIDLNNYICAVPFTSIEVHDNKRFLCCASWLTKFLPDDTNHTMRGIQMKLMIYEIVY